MQPGGLGEQGNAQHGGMKGKIRIAEDFDAPLPEDLIGAFEGKGTS